MVGSHRIAAAEGWLVGKSGDAESIQADIAAGVCSLIALQRGRQCYKRLELRIPRTALQTLQLHSDFGRALQFSLRWIVLQI